MELKTPPPPNNHKKMRTFLELEGKLGPIPQSSSNQFRPPQPDINPSIRKVTKITEKRKRVAPTKRFKAKIAAEPNSDKVTTYLPNTKALINTESQKTLKPTPESGPPPLEDAPVCTGTPWTKAGKMLGNLFEARKYCLLSPNYIDDNTKSTKPPIIKVEPKPEGQPATSLKAEKCAWGPNCPFCKNQEEDWKGDHQKQLQQQPQPQQETQMTQEQHPQTLSYLKPHSSQKFSPKTPNVAGQYPCQL